MIFKKTSRVAATTVAAVVLQAVILPALASAAVSVSWETPEGLVVSRMSSVTAAASASPDKIAKWCLKINQSADIANWPGAIEDSFGYQAARTGNCWTRNGSQSLTGAAFGFDSTSWANASYIFQVTVTDSNGKSATSSELTITTQNLSPTTSWTTPDGSVFSGSSSIVASATPADDDGTSKISKWCLKVNQSSDIINWPGAISATFATAQTYPGPLRTGNCWARYWYSESLAGAIFSFARSVTRPQGLA